jgi:hypothetical protein
MAAAPNDTTSHSKTKPVSLKNVLDQIQKLYLINSELFCFFAVLVFELRTYILSHSTSPVFFVLGFFEIGSYELFAWAGFKL